MHWCLFQLVRCTTHVSTLSHTCETAFAMWINLPALLERYLNIPNHIFSSRLRSAVVFSYFCLSLPSFYFFPGTAAGYRRSDTGTEIMAR